MKYELISLVEAKWLPTQYLSVNKRKESMRLYGDPIVDKKGEPVLDKNGEPTFEPVAGLSLMGCILTICGSSDLPNSAAKYMIREIQKLTGKPFIAYWEDAKGRTKEDVIELLKRLP